ncbi:hypothetical protein BGX38DRAFT_1275492 [Terfezia claveryi]|nr:hypothetical protein BGX38DRAFT_1275492 [Terfezia claveryi]
MPSTPGSFPDTPRVPLAGAPPGVAGGPLAPSLCYQPPLAGWAPAVGGPPNTVRVHIIKPEMHGPDPLYGGWIFSSTTISSTVVLVGGMLMAHGGPNMMDFQIELDPIGQVNTPSTVSGARNPPVVAPRNTSDTKGAAKPTVTKGKTTVAAAKDQLSTKGNLRKGSRVTKPAKGPKETTTGKGTTNAKTGMTARGIPVVKATPAAKGTFPKVIIPKRKQRPTQSPNDLESPSREDARDPRPVREAADHSRFRSLAPQFWQKTCDGWLSIYGRHTGAGGGSWGRLGREVAGDEDEGDDEDEGEDEGEDAQGENDADEGMWMRGGMWMSGGMWMRGMWMRGIWMRDEGDVDGDDVDEGNVDVDEGDVGCGVMWKRVMRMRGMRMRVMRMRIMMMGGARREGSAGMPDESPIASLFSRWNGVSSPIASLESPMRRTGAMEDVVGTPSKTKAVKGTPSQKRNRSITQFTGFLRDMTESAGNRIEHITLFEEPFPDPQRMEDMLNKVWRETEVEYQKDHSRDNKIDSYLRSVQSRTRSHLVSEAKKNIAFLYQFDQNTLKQYIQDHIGRLLKQIDSHVLRVIARVVVIGFGRKKQLTLSIISISMARRNSAISTQRLESGECAITFEFSYVNCSDVYKRLLSQWRQYPTSVQEMIVKVTQSEIVKKGQQSGKKVRWQQDAAYEVDDRR